MLLSAYFILMQQNQPRIINGNKLLFFFLVEGQVLCASWPLPSNIMTNRKMASDVGRRQKELSKRRIGKAISSRVRTF